jgi:hypothetical protein
MGTPSRRPTREMTVTFLDRHEAGRRPAEALQRFRSEDPIVLGLPRGGVLVAAAVASALHARSRCSWCGWGRCPWVMPERSWIEPCRFVAVSLALFALGLVVWWTAWLAWPAALVAVALAVVRWRHPRNAS